MTMSLEFGLTRSSAGIEQFYITSAVKSPSRFGFSVITSVVLKLFQLIHGSRAHLADDLSGTEGWSSAISKPDSLNRTIVSTVSAVI